MTPKKLSPDELETAIKEGRDARDAIDGVRMSNWEIADPEPVRSCQCEALRARVKDLEATLKGKTIAWSRADETRKVENESLKKRVAELEDALETVTAGPCDWDGERSTCHRIARDALQERGAPSPTDKNPGHCTEYSHWTPKGGGQCHCGELEEDSDD